MGLNRVSIGLNGRYDKAKKALREHELKLEEVKRIAWSGSMSDTAKIDAIKINVVPKRDEE